MSTPISAIRVSAVLRLMPGMVPRSSTFSEKGAHSPARPRRSTRYRLINLPDGTVGVVDLYHEALTTLILQPDVCVAKCHVRLGA